MMQEEIPLKDVKVNKESHVASPEETKKNESTQEPFVCPDLCSNFDCRMDLSGCFCYSTKSMLCWSLVFVLFLIGLALSIVGAVNNSFSLIIIGLSLCILFLVLGCIFYCNYHYEENQYRFFK